MTNLIDKLENIDWDFPNSSREKGIHNIHPYPAKFIPEIPRTLIDVLGVPKNTYVFDPFCGSGATLIESQSAGFPAIGIDLNPIACLISRVKTQTLPDEFLDIANKVINSASNNNNSIEIPQIPRIDHWYKPEIQEAIAKLLVNINQVQNENIRDALRLSLSAILVKVSNQESDTRYAAIEKNVSTSNVYSYYLSTVEKIWKSRNEISNPRPEVFVFQKDILTVDANDINKPIGMVITSPPYPNAYEYWLYHKYRMYWLGFDPINMREHEIGARAHYFQSNPSTKVDFQNQMMQLMQLLTKLVVEDGYICIVIGRSKIHGEIIDNSSMLVEIGKFLNLEVIDILPRKIAESRKNFNLAHANIKTENILIFKKTHK